jgi:hypothetical protein
MTFAAESLAGTFCQGGRRGEMLNQKSPIQAVMEVVLASAGLAHWREFLSLPFVIEEHATSVVVPHRAFSVQTTVPNGET